MSKKILILDNDMDSVNSISQLLTLLNLESLVLHNWSYQMRAELLEDLGAIFVNVELPSIKIESLVKELQMNDFTAGIPVFLIYSRSFAPSVVKAKTLPHAGELKKPVRMEDIYTMLSHYLSFDEICSKTQDIQERLSLYNNIYSEYEDWISKIGTLLGD